MDSLLIDDHMVNEFATTHLPRHLDVARRSELRHSTRSFGQFWAVSSTLGGMVGRRNQRDIRKTEGEYLGVLLVHSGREVFSQRGVKAAVNAGSALIWDGVLPAECYSEGPLDKSTFFLPRDLGRRILPHLDTIVGKPLSATATLKLLSSWIESSMTVDHLDETAAMTAGRTAADLLASAVGNASEMVLDERAIRLMEARSFIDEHLGDCELTIDDIAAGVSTSVRQMHLLFEGTGETCRQYLVRRRMETAHRLLLEGPDLAITTIAMRCGFSTPSSFSRSFRAARGCTPKEARSGRNG